MGVNTIGKFLSKDYQELSSQGSMFHIFRIEEVPPLPQVYTSLQYQNCPKYYSLSVSLSLSMFKNLPPPTTISSI